MSGAAEILLVGFGNMGQALVRGWLGRGRAASHIVVVDPVPAARAVATELGLTAAADVARQRVTIIGDHPEGDPPRWPTINTGGSPYAA